MFVLEARVQILVWEVSASARRTDSEAASPSVEPQRPHISQVLRKILASMRTHSFTRRRQQLPRFSIPAWDPVNPTLRTSPELSPT